MFFCFFFFWVRERERESEVRLHVYCCVVMPAVGLRLYSQQYKCRRACVLVISYFKRLFRPSGRGWVWGNAATSSNDDITSIIRRIYWIFLVLYLSRRRVSGAAIDTQSHSMGFRREELGSLWSHQELPKTSGALYAFVPPQRAISSIDGIHI